MENVRSDNVVVETRVVVVVVGYNSLIGALRNSDGWTLQRDANGIKTMYKNDPNTPHVMMLIMIITID